MSNALVEYIETVCTSIKVLGSWQDSLKMDYAVGKDETGSYLWQADPSDVRETIGEIFLDDVTREKIGEFLGIGELKEKIAAEQKEATNLARLHHGKAPDQADYWLGRADGLNHALVLLCELLDVDK